LVIETSLYYNARSEKHQRKRNNYLIILYNFLFLK